MLQNLRSRLRSLTVPSRPGTTKPKRQPAPPRTFERLETRLVLDGGPLLITEIMAANVSGLKDEDGHFSDWIEIYNPTALEESLDGWYLTDNDGVPDKWQFPDVTIKPGERRIVFASKKDRTDPAGELHTNFSLDADGEYLALVQPDGVTVSHSYGEYPEQFDDVSFGTKILPLVTPETDVRYLVPTAEDAAASDESWRDRNFDDATWIHDDREPTIVITEAGSGVPDYVEIQNVSDRTIDTSGWVLALNRPNDPAVSDARYNGIHTPWNLPPSMAPGEIIYLNDMPSSPSNPNPHYFGENIFWGTGGEGWAMIVRQDGQVADFVPWHYTDTELADMKVTINGRQIRGSSAWSGDGAVIPTDLGMTTLWRTGAFDHDDASDFRFRRPDVANPGVTNPGLALPLVAQRVPGVGFSSLPGAFGGMLADDLSFEMYRENSSLWTRIPFEVEDPADLFVLTLRMRYNDGFVAYLNGHEVASSNAPDALAWNSEATAARTIAEANEYESYGITFGIEHLVEGTNVLAIHGLNTSADDGDFLLVAGLDAVGVQMPQHYLAEPTPGEINSIIMTSPPVFTVPGQTFTDTIDVGIAAAAPRTVIYYTTDGSMPTVDSPVYDGPITLSETSQVRALAEQEGFAPSRVVGAGFSRLASNTLDISSDLPIIIVDTFGRAISQGAFINVNMSVFEPDELTGRTTILGTPEVSTRTGIHIRGASSSGFDKKQYRVETRDQYDQDLDVPLLGLPSESDWVLGGPYADKSLIRNAFAYGLGRDIGLEAPRTRFCELYINRSGDVNTSDYLGVYVLTETVKRSAERLDIPTLSPADVAEPDITGGYVMRFEGGRTEAAARLNGWNSLQLHNVEEYTTEQRNWISNFVNELKAVLNRPDFADPETGYAKYLDVEAFINLMVVNELLREQDSYVRSNYLWKDRDVVDAEGNVIKPGKLTQGPLWDYNLTAGVGCCFDNKNTQGWQYEQGYNRAFSQAGGDDHDWTMDLLRDPDFAQAWKDRWYELRQGILSDEAIDVRINSLAAQVNEAQARNFQKWNILNTNLPFSPPNTQTWEEQIAVMKSWIHTRTTWIDGRLLNPKPPAITPSDPDIAAGATIEITDTSGGEVPIYYTTDGSDPRAPGGEPVGTLYTGPVPLSASAKVSARTFDGNRWSVLETKQYEVEVPLRVTELMYNPADPSAAEAAAGFTDNDDFEFIELRNVGQFPIDLSGVRFTNGIDYTFPEITLAAGERVVVPRNAAAFALRYDTAGLQIAPEYRNSVDDSNRFKNSNETIELTDAGGATIQEFRYNDDWYPQTDGEGYSLVMVNEIGPPDWWSNGRAWRASYEPGGSPGKADVSLTPTVLGRHLFYNNSAFDGNDAAANAADNLAIAPDKSPLLPGETAAPANYSNYDKGINGIIVDIGALSDVANLSLDDFHFRVGNDSDPASWPPAPTPLPIAVRPGEGVDDSDRVMIRFADHAIAGKWLQVTVLATANTGLNAPDVFYFGNAPGEAGDNPQNAIVNATDELVTRKFPHSPTDPAAIDDAYDYNRDALVDATDQVIARENQTNPRTMLRLITIEQPAAVEPTTLPVDFDWLVEFEQTNSKDLKPKKRSVEEAVDLLLATETA